MARYSTKMFKLLNMREGHIGAHHIILSIFCIGSKAQNFKNGSGKKNIRNKDKTIAFCFTPFPPHLPGKSINNTKTLILQSISVPSLCCFFRD